MLKTLNNNSGRMALNSKHSLLWLVLGARPYGNNMTNKNILTEQELNEIFCENMGFSVDYKLCKRASYDNAALVELGCIAQKANQLSFAKTIFALARRRGAEQADYYLALIARKRGR
ncbi:MAG: hypothetical protein KAS93_07075 [Gammaproteobacteria bacterium]|nr:hypothetical protein [Gammaproteobacteria bacterium]